MNNNYCCFVLKIETAIFTRYGGNLRKVMKWDLVYLSNPDYLLVTVYEQFTLKEQIQMFEEILAIEEWTSGVPILFDNRLLVMNNIDSSTIENSVIIMQNFCRQHSETKIAGLVNQGLNFGLGRQFETIIEIKGNARFRIFKDKDIALNWLLD